MKRTVSPRTARAVLLTGMLASSVGDVLASLALDLHAAAIGSSSLLAALLVGQSIPPVLLGPAGGLLADRALRWWMWPLSLLGQGSVLAILAWTDSTVVMVAGMTLVAIAAAVTAPVADKLLAHYTDDTGRSGGRVATVMGASQALGVAAGGAGFPLFGASNLLAVDAVTFVVFAVLATMITTRDAIELDNTTPAAGVIGEVFQGFRRLTGPDAFGVAGVAVAVATVTATSIEGVVGVFVLTRHAHFTAAAVGVVIAAWGVGVMVAGMFSSRLRVSARVGMAVASLVMGVVYVTVAMTLPPVWAAVVLFAAGGVGNGVFNALLVAVILRAVPGPEQGRAWAAWRWLTSCCFLVGYLTGGVLGACHAVPGMLLGGSVAAGAGLTALALTGRRRCGCPTDAP